MLTIRQSADRPLICLFFCLGLVQFAAAQNQPPGADGGSNNPFRIFLGVVADVNQELGLNATMADWTARKTRIVTQAQTGLMSKERAAAELYALGMIYRNADRPEDAMRLFRDSIDYAPDSYSAANSWQMIGWLKFSPGHNPGAAVEPFQEADRVLQDLLKDPAYQSGEARTKLLRDRAIVRKTTGDWYRYSHQFDKAMGTYKDLVESRELAENLPPQLLLNANRELLRSATKEGDADAVESYAGAVNKILRSGSLPPGRTVAFRLETIRQQYANPDDPFRIRELLELWNKPELAGIKEILDVGDELACHYFFKEPMATEEFRKTSAALFERLKPHLAAETDSSSGSKDSFSHLDALYVRNLLMATEFARMTGDEPKRKRLVEEFERRYKDRNITISVSASRKLDTLTRLLAIYNANMTKHAAATREAALKAERQSTPAGNRKN